MRLNSNQFPIENIQLKNFKKQKRNEIMRQYFNYGFNEESLKSYVKMMEAKFYE